MNLSISGLCRARASKNIGSCIGWMVQNPQHIMVLDLAPHNFSLMRPAPNPPRKEQMFLVKVANGRKSRSGMLKAVKDLPNGSLHLQVRVKNNSVAFGVRQSNGQGQFDGSTPCFVEDTPLQAGTQHEKLIFRHRSLPTQQKTNIESGGILEPLFIQKRGMGECANFQEMMPIAGVARKSRDFQPQDQPYLPEPDLRHEPLEPQAVGSGSSRAAQILIKHHHALVC